MVLKQKTFWALLLCIVFAVGFAFLGSIRYPSIKTVDNYVRSINKNDINLMYQIYSKDDQSARVILFALKNKNGICTSVSSETVDLVLIEDKYYFEY